MKKPSTEFLLTVILLLVVFAVSQQYIVHGYEGVTDQLLSTCDKLLQLLADQMTHKAV